MLERIELVLDGSSALYGSDAVAGVANFITRDDFEGVELPVSRDGGFVIAPQVCTDWSTSRDTDAVLAELVTCPRENLGL